MLEEHIRDISKPSLVYCFGVSNFGEVGLDYEMLGYMVGNMDKLEVVFRCYYDDTSMDTMSYVGLRKKKDNDLAWVVLEY